MTIRTLIVDNEAHARARIWHALRDEPDFALVGECEVLFDTRALFFLVVAILVASCGKAPDPSFTRHNGDFGAYLDEHISNRPPALHASNKGPSIQTVWHSRVLTDNHKSGEYLDGRRALQIATSATNFLAVESLLTQRFGPPTLPLRREESGWRHIGWTRPDLGLGVWLVEEGDQCRIEIVTQVATDKP